LKYQTKAHTQDSNPSPLHITHSLNHLSYHYSLSNTCQECFLGYSKPIITCTLLTIISMNFLGLTPG